MALEYIEDRLPLELLIHCFHFLAPADLVSCRKVCRRWHEVVAALEAHDAPFRFQCGDQDLRACTVATTRAAPLFVQYRDHRFCTCGGLLHTRSAAAPAQYASAHLTRYPPVRWECAASGRQLAVAVTDVAASLFQFHDVINNYAWVGFQGQWVPCWFALPAGMVRPTTAEGMAKLVQAVLTWKTNALLSDEKGTLLDRLCDRDAAAAFYAGVAEETSDADEEDGGQRKLASRLRALAFRRFVRSLPDRAAYRQGDESLMAMESLQDSLYGKALAWTTHGPPVPSSLYRPERIERWTALARAFLASPAGQEDFDAAADAFDVDQDFGDLSDEFGDYINWTVEVAGQIDDRVRAAYRYLSYRALVGNCHPLYFDARETRCEHGWRHVRLLARQAAESWRLACAHGWVPHLRSEVFARDDFPFADWGTQMSERIQQHLDSQVAVVDDVAARLATLVDGPVPVAVSLKRRRDLYWVGGLSRDGHLVGALTFRMA